MDTFREAGDSPGKLGLIPDVAEGGIPFLPKPVTAIKEELAAYQLVGGVTAHQG